MFRKLWTGHLYVLQAGKQPCFARTNRVYDWKFNQCIFVQIVAIIPLAPGFGASFWMMRDLRFGQRTAISLRSNPLHWILSPLSWEPTSSKQWTMFSTMMFSRVKKASLGQWRNTPGFRDRGLLLPRNIVSRLGQQLAEKNKTNKNKSIFP